MRFAAFLAAALALVAPAAAEPGAVRAVDVEGTRFKVTMEDGSVRFSDQLVGATIVMATRNGTVRLRVDAVERDAKAIGQDVWLHTLSTRQRDGSWAPVCQPDPQGKPVGFPLALKPGIRQSLLAAEPGEFEIFCTGGARAKCVRFGYQPWTTGPGGQSMLGAYNICVRMVRADYGGEGEGTTRNGMSIDFYDTFGIQKPDNDEEHVFEAGWDEDGAVCVHHVRVKENTTLAQLEQRYPRLKGRTGAICTEAFARAHGAILFNKSRE